METTLEKQVKIDDAFYDPPPILKRRIVLNAAKRTLIQKERE